MKKMIIKKYKYLTKASNNNKVLALSSKAKKHHDQSHLLFKLNMKYGYIRQLRKQHLHRGVVNSSYNLYIAVLSVISVLLLPFGCVDAVGYSYTRFVGPVAGPEHRIYVDDVGNVQSVAGNDASSRLDYVAKPEYEFSYGVEDAEAHILHNRNEMRDGDAVKGVYSVVDPDGTLRVVKYTADEVNGFQAEVIMNGISLLNGQQHKDNTPSKTHNNNYQYYNSQPQLKEAVYNPNLEHQINHYYPQSEYQTPPALIIHHFNNDNYDNNDDDDDDGDIDSGSDYNDDYQPQYEVREKQNENGNDNEHENGNGGEGGGGNKEKEHHDDNNDDEDNDSEDDYDDSEELEDYKDAVRGNEASKESDEYY